jgi:hypothetical protein
MVFHVRPRSGSAEVGGWPGPAGGGGPRLRVSQASTSSLHCAQAESLRIGQLSWPVRVWRPLPSRLLDSESDAAAASAVHRDCPLPGSTELEP